MEVLEGLNPPQGEAVQAIEGPVLVLAGPGSGKTRVLTQRIAYLIRICGIQPHHILAVTFTNKAAKEMIARLRGLIGENTSRLTMGTFHAICARILRREAGHLGLGSNFAIYDEDDQERLVTRILKELDLDAKLYRPKAVQSAISRAKNELVTAEAYQPPTYWHEAVKRVFLRYEEQKAANNALDFDDLLLKAEELFRTQDAVRERYQQRYLYILVDEFQDTNRAQYELVRHLAGERRNLFVVGDEDQSIYSWRGADFRNVLRFRTDYPEAKVFKLEQNYRSTQTILNAAQAVIAHNTQRTPKKLWTEHKGGAPVHLFEAYDEREEAEYVVGEIQRLVSRGECRPGGCAVMYRTNAQSRVLEDAFVRHGLPYQLIGGTRFYQRREIKDILSYLRLVENPADAVSLTRIINVPVRGIGEKTLEQLGEWAGILGLSLGEALQHLVRSKQESGLPRGLPFTPRSAKLLVSFGQMFAELLAARAHSNLSALLTLVLDKTAYLSFLRDGTEEGEDRANNVRELFSVTAGYDEAPIEVALPAFLEQAALVSDSDEIDAQADRVTLLTLHTAKGLEYEVVLMVGMEEDICPHVRSKDDPNALEEERRLCYVGITRAKKHLYLLRTFRRTLFGSSAVREPSRFLMDIPPKLTDGNLVHSAPARAAGGAKAPTPASGEKLREIFSRRRAGVQQGIARRKAWEEPKSPRAESIPPQTMASISGRRSARPESAEEGEEARTLPRQTRPVTTFRPGETVIHPVFGKGTVIESKIVGDDEEVSVAFADRGIKRLLASFAKMEKR